MSAQMLAESQLGVGTWLRLEVDAWSMVKRPETNECGRCRPRPYWYVNTNIKPFSSLRKCKITHIINASHTTSSSLFPSKTEQASVKGLRPKEVLIYPKSPCLRRKPISNNNSKCFPPEKHTSIYKGVKEGRDMSQNSCLFTNASLQKSKYSMQQLQAFRSQKRARAYTKGLTPSLPETLFVLQIYLTPVCGRILGL